MAWMSVLCTEMERGGNLKTYDCHLVPDDFNFGSSEMLQRNDACETRTVKHVSRVGQDMEGQAYVPYLHNAP